MEKRILSLFLILMLCVSSITVIHAENGGNNTNAQPEVSDMVDVTEEVVAETDKSTFGYSNVVPSNKNESFKNKNTFSLTADHFKLIVRIPDNGEYIKPDVIRFNLFDENDVWLGNRAIEVSAPGMYELDYLIDTYDIGTKFKAVATTGLSSYDYYGTIFTLNEECIIETYAYRDENKELHTCTEGYLVASVETYPLSVLHAIDKEAYINLNRMQSKTDYFVWVSKANFTVNVFLRNYDKWQLIQEFPCSIGAPGTPTVTGQFEYHQYQNKWQYSGYYVGPIMRFYNGYAIHSTLINDDGTDRDGRVGEMISHGCVRVRPDAIDWLVSYVPLGTKIYLTDF